ncbi:PaaX family transcriptional regulator [Actinomadura craniellae]|uniref:PaaX family transcriptional regulator n=1 Tax=Actinomadura craniellae TaxID=2231787 RepID=A0A365HA27_9ACTN|nr:PaaX family transcriptional regulator C-terminal domain-containing protein [Actinomadura craniellae]RAY15879.1 PaaX family transcriptional regulator [Actinomadura craniellae]
MAPSTNGDSPAELKLPRTQSGPQPQHLLITLLGDYWYGRDEHLPSAALVELLGEFGISAVAARAALSRLARRGLLESSKLGRRTSYGLTDRAARVLSDGMQRIMSFGLATRPWDGLWRVVAFSVPEEQRDVRHAARNRLRWYGFAPLYDGVWVSPRDGEQAAAESLAELGVRTYTVLTAQAPPGVPQGCDPLDAWDLDDLRSHYDAFVAERGDLLARTRAGAISAAEALLARTAVMDTWRHFPNLDPELPEELLPADWPRRRAYEVFVELYNSLGPLAEIRVRQVVARHSPTLAPLVHQHTATTAPTHP